MMIDQYKIYHRPSGMCFRKATAANRSNLSKFGTVYRNRPNLAATLGATYYKSAVRLNKKEIDTLPVDLDEWVVVLYDPAP